VSPALKGPSSAPLAALSLPHGAGVAALNQRLLSEGGGGIKRAGGAAHGHHAPSRLRTIADVEVGTTSPPQSPAHGSTHDSSHAAAATTTTGAAAAAAASAPPPPASVAATPSTAAAAPVHHHQPLGPHPHVTHAAPIVLASHAPRRPSRQDLEVALVHEAAADLKPLDEGSVGVTVTAV
jgi:hypothetical protein